MKEFSHNELYHLDQISKINIFIKNLSIKEYNHDETNHLTRISKNIFIKNFISEKSTTTMRRIT
jgi:hypothetical protein